MNGLYRPVSCDFVFLTAGGDAIYYFLTFLSACILVATTPTRPLECSPPTANIKLPNLYKQFFASQLINLEWLKPGNDGHQLYSAESGIEDSAGHKLVTAYAVKRPDKQWALLIVNRDQENPHTVKVNFHDAETRRDTSFADTVDSFTFGGAQYRWDPLRKHADPDGPVLKTQITASRDFTFTLPAASVVVSEAQCPLAESRADAAARVRDIFLRKQLSADSPDEPCPQSVNPELRIR